jgi:hypothetical protein
MNSIRDRYSEISDYERGARMGTFLGLTLGVLLTLWVIYGGM